MKLRLFSGLAALALAALLAACTPAAPAEHGGGTARPL